MSIAANKATARIRAKAVRDGLSPDARDFLRRWPGVPGSAVIGGYWPMGSEVDIRPLLERASASNSVVLPVVVEGRRVLGWRRWTPGCAMEAGPLRTTHPVGGVADGAAPPVPDVVLVPLLAFTRRGDRLGYGGGYYDATLAGLRADNPDLLALGIAHGGQAVRVLPSEPHDQRLDAVLTENGIIRFD